MDAGSIAAFLGLSVASVFGFTVTVVRMYSSNERAKAEMTVQMLLDWTNKLEHVADRCVSLSGCLSTTAIEAIWEEKGVVVEEPKAFLALEHIFGMDKLNLN